jgi:ABC-type multidrug transport system fused ATPase/permease subunit
VISAIHRLHLLPVFDEFVVFDAGIVTEAGSLTDLVAGNGAFAQSWTKNRAKTSFEVST